MSESEPQGKSPHVRGSKLDSGKNRASLVMGNFSLALLEVGKVGTFGANKYTDSGWIEVPQAFDRYSDAMQRHFLAEYSGEKNDQDSGFSHASHLTWNALCRLELILRHHPSVYSSSKYGVFGENIFDELKMIMKISDSKEVKTIAQKLMSRIQEKKN